jgi:hypothetical protein
MGRVVGLLVLLLLLLLLQRRRRLVVLLVHFVHWLRWRWRVHLRLLGVARHRLGGV